MQLSAHADHGPVLLDGVFGILSFSPDGKYLMYAAEQRVHGKGKSKELMKHHIKSNDISSDIFILRHVPIPRLLLRGTHDGEASDNDIRGNI